MIISKKKRLRNDALNDSFLKMAAFEANKIHTFIIFFLSKNEIHSINNNFPQLMKLLSLISKFELRRVMRVPIKINAEIRRRQRNISISLLRSINTSMALSSLSS